MSRARELSELPNGVDVDANGNVGIGTNTPSGYNSKLAVLGNIAMANTQSRFYPYYISSTNHAYVSSTAGGDLTFGTGLSGVSERMRIDTAGRVTTPAQPAFRAVYSNNATRIVPVNGELVFDSAPLNIGSHYSTSTGRFTAPVTGVYQFNLTAQHDGATSNSGWLDIRLNGVTTRTRYEHFSGATYDAGGISVVVNMSAGDFVSIIQSGSNIWWSDHTCFSGVLIG